MYKVNQKAGLRIIAATFLIITGTALADSASVFDSSSSAPQAAPAANISNFPANQTQSYQTMEKQLVQAQQGYVNSNSLNPTSYNLPAAPSTLPSNSNVNS